MMAITIWISSVFYLTVAQASNQLENMSFASMPGDKVQIVMQFSEPVAEPGSFTTDSPARIALDFPDTSIAMEKKRQKIGIGVARAMTAVESGGRTRVVINLTSLTQYTTQTMDNKVVLTLDQAKTAVSRVATDKTSVTDIDFKIGEDDKANVIITFSDNRQNVNLIKQGGKLIVDMENVLLPESLQRRLDVNDFRTPVTFIDTYARGYDTKMVVETRGDFEHLGYQAGNLFTIEIKELTKREKEALDKAKFGYTGERLSLNFQDIEVRAVLQLIADFTGMNMVTSDTVSGNITLRLKNVPWDQALDIILKTKGLGMRQEGNVMRVAPAEELAAIEKQELEANRQIADLLPLVTETIQLRYVTATAVVTLLEEIGSNEAQKNQVDDVGAVDAGIEDEESGASYVSSRATIVGDSRTNKLIVRDTARNIAQLRKLLEELDTPIKQVLIDARVVSATNDFEKDLGLSWNFARKDSNTDGLTTAQRGEFESGVGTTRQTSDASVDLGALQKNVLGITFALLGSDSLIDLEISASQVEGTAEVISSPRVVTTNGSPAKIKQGKEVPYLEQNENGNTVAFKDAVLSLDVTPLIIPGDKVFMDLKINKDAPLDIGPSLPGAAPQIDTKEVQTSVLVDNGDTVVLGGIFERDRQESTDGVPVLQDIPVIGNAFKVRTNSDSKSELIIFITPKILDETLSIR